MYVVEAINTHKFSGGHRAGPPMRAWAPWLVLASVCQGQCPVLRMPCRLGSPSGRHSFARCRASPGECTACTLVGGNPDGPETSARRCEYRSPVHGGSGSAALELCVADRLGVGGCMDSTLGKYVSISCAGITNRSLDGSLSGGRYNGSPMCLCER